MDERNPNFWYCVTCGERITRTTPGPKIYCSIKCRPTAPAYIRNPKPKVDPATAPKCKYCGKPVLRTGPGPKIYCSTNCRQYAYNERHPEYRAKRNARRRKPKKAKAPKTEYGTGPREVRVQCKGCQLTFVYMRQGGPGAAREFCDDCRKKRNAVKTAENGTMAEYYVYLDDEQYDETKASGIFDWWDTDDDEQAMLDEIRRTGMIQGHRREQPLSNEVELLAQLIRRELREEELKERRKKKPTREEQALEAAVEAVAAFAAHAHEQR